MPNKTIYVREGDVELWERAEELAGGSVSALITEALKRYVEEEELRKETGMETIQVKLSSAHSRYGWEEQAYDAEFVGRWLLEPDPDDTRTSEPGYDAGAYYGVALTQRSNIAIYIRHVNDGFAPVLNVYESFEEAEQSGQPGDILTRAASTISDGYVRKMDI